jgi:hypothetical protein
MFGTTASPRQFVSIRVNSWLAAFRFAEYTPFPDQRSSAKISGEFVFYLSSGAREY